MSAEAIKMIEAAIQEDDIDEIMLDGIEIGEISDELRKKLESVEEMSMLSMNDCKLKSLANLPKLPHIIRLELMNNKFPASDLKHIVKLENLQSLSLSDNTIKSVDDLKVLVDMELLQLDLSGTELAKQADYRDKVFRMFNTLQILDNMDQEGKEIEYEDDELDFDDNGLDDEDDEDDDDEGDFEDAEDDDEEEDFDDEDDDEDDGEDEEESQNKKTKK